MVIKNLGSLFERAKGVSGGAIMGDGRISLILDIEDIISAATNSKQQESKLI
jgi:two-component system chemotaxis sensor kinase CheA